mmetsp:Transcript_93188/g.156592  ORF Transcript_93188/g.156592 Transcript_93188/m.156592 type:complete len:232 (-) Transcript_93188:1044-1739(-)
MLKGQKIPGAQSFTPGCSASLPSCFAQLGSYRLLARSSWGWLRFIFWLPACPLGQPSISYQPSSGSRNIGTPPNLHPHPSRTRKKVVFCHAKLLDWMGLDQLLHIFCLRGTVQDDFACSAESLPLSILWQFVKFNLFFVTLPATLPATGCSGEWRKAMMLALLVFRVNTMHASLESRYTHPQKSIITSLVQIAGGLCCIMYTEAAVLRMEIEIWFKAVGKHVSYSRLYIKG